MKILFISNLFQPNSVGGYERLCGQVAEKFSENNEIVAVTSSFGNIIPQNDIFPVYRELKLLAGVNSIYEPFLGDSNVRKLVNDENINILNKILKIEKPDLIFVWNLYFFDQSFLNALEKSGIRTVFFLTDNWLISFLNQNYLKKYFDEILKPLNNINFISVIKIGLCKIKTKLFFATKKTNLQFNAIFASQFIKNLYKKSGINFKSSVVIYNGVNLENYINRKICRDYELNNKKINLLFAGRIVQIKGVHILIEAFSVLVLKFGINNIHLTIIGDDSDKKYLENLNLLIKKSKIDGKITFKKPVQESDLFDEFQNYDIYIFPSLYEPFSLTLIYAMAAGIPTIASDAGGNPEIVINEKTGLLYDKFDANDLADKIKILIKDKKLRERLSISGRNKANNFGFEKMCVSISAYLKNIYEK